MHARKILLVDGDSKNIRILQETFSKKNYRMDHACSDLEALQKVEQHPYDVVLSEIAPPDIDGHRLLEKLQRNPKTASIPLIFLTKKSDIWNRVRSFRLGAKDYIVKPIHVMEIIARIGMVLSRLEKRDEEEEVARKKIVGRLEDLSVADLIETFGVERKTGILTVSNENGLNGQLFIKNGTVINANTNGLRSEEAVYKMMGWNKGRFSMLFKDVTIADVISISNLGLLIQGIKRMQSREAILSQLPSIDSVLVTTNNFKKIVGPKQLTRDLDNFLSLLDGERTLARIIDESSYDDITTLERLLKLYRLGFLRSLRGKVPEQDEAEYAFSEDTIVETKHYEKVPAETTSVDSMPTTEIDEDIKLPWAEEDVQLSSTMEDSVEAITSEPGSKDTSAEPELMEDVDIYPELPKWAITKTAAEAHSDEESLKKVESDSEMDDLSRLDILDREVTSVESQDIPLPEEKELDQEPVFQEPAIDSDDFFRVDVLDHKEIEAVVPAAELSGDIIPEEKIFHEDHPVEREELFSPDILDRHEKADEFKKVPYQSEKETEEAVAHLVSSDEAESEEPINIEQGAISVAESIDKGTEPTISQKDQISARLKLAQAHVLIFGPDQLGRKDVIDALTGNQAATMAPSRQNLSDIYYGTVPFKGGHYLNVMGVSTDQEFTPLVDYLALRTIGYILLIDLQHEENWDYLGYLIRTLDDKLDVPSLLATCIPKDKVESLVGKFQSHLSLDDAKRLYVCESFDKTTSKRMIFTLFGVDNKTTENIHVVQRRREIQHALMQ